MKARIIAKFILKNVLPAIAIVVLLFSIPIAIFYYRSLWKGSADYDGFGTDYANIMNCVRNYTADNYGTVEDKLYMVSKEGIYDYEAKVYLDFTDAAKESFSAIRTTAFKDLEYIKVQGNRLLFCAGTGRYAVVYSPNTDPKWYVDGKELRIDSKRICVDWYHVRRIE